MRSGRIGHLAETVIVSLPSECSLAACEFRAVTRRVAGDDEIAFALVPWERVVWMVGSDFITLEIAMALIMADGENEVVGGQRKVDISGGVGIIIIRYRCLFSE